VGSLFVKRKFKMPRAIQKYARYSRYVLAIALFFMVAGDSVIKTSMNSYLTVKCQDIVY
jgi:hypothetical protein